MRRLFIFLFLCLCGYPLHADTLILSVRQAWHPPEQIASAVVVKDVQDRGVYLAGKDGSGTLIQFPKNLIVSEKELPVITIPKNILELSDCATLKEIGKTLDQLSKSNPIVAKALKPYLAAFATYIQPEIDKFEQGNVKKDGKWIPGEEYRAKIAAEEQAQRERRIAEQKQREERRRAIEEQNRRAIEGAKIQKEAQKVENEKKRAVEEERARLAAIEQARSEKWEVLVKLGSGAIFFLLIVGMFLLAFKRKSREDLYTPTPQEINVAVGYGIVLCLVGLLLSVILIGIPILVIGLWMIAFPDAAVRKSKQRKT